MFIEDAFIWYCVRSYKPLEGVQFRNLWNRYINGGGFAGPMGPTITKHPQRFDKEPRMSEPNLLLYERCRHLFLDTYERLKLGPEFASADHALLCDAAVKNLDTSCKVSCMGATQYGWTDPNKVQTDWAAHRDMNTLEYCYFGFILELRHCGRRKERLGYGLR